MIFFETFLHDNSKARQYFSRYFFSGYPVLIERRMERERERIWKVARRNNDEYRHIYMTKEGRE